MAAPLRSIYPLPAPSTTALYETAYLAGHGELAPSANNVHRSRLAHNSHNKLGGEQHDALSTSVVHRLGGATQPYYRTTSTGSRAPYTHEYDEAQLDAKTATQRRAGGASTTVSTFASRQQQEPSINWGAEGRLIVSAADQTRVAPREFVRVRALPRAGTDAWVISQGLPSPRTATTAAPLEQPAGWSTTSASMSQCVPAPVPLDSYDAGVSVEGRINEGAQNNAAAATNASASEPHYADTKRDRTRNRLHWTRVTRTGQAQFNQRTDYTELFSDMNDECFFNKGR
jgi:hypothetical protein